MLIRGDTMRQGKNVAEEIKNEPYRRYLYDQSSKSSGLCFFISHKNEDADAALEIGNHIMNDFGYNIYLDLFDEALQVADQNKDVETIVKSIHNGLKYSTHLLCVVTEKSKESWWIPYEIGFAQANNKKTASLKLKASEYLPTFLRANGSDVFYTVKELDVYLTKQSIWEPVSPEAEYIYFQYDSASSDI